jgi:hypothetical protein
MKTRVPACTNAVVLRSHDDNSMRKRGITIVRARDNANFSSTQIRFFRIRMRTSRALPVPPSFHNDMFEIKNVTTHRQTFFLTIVTIVGGLPLREAFLW